MSQVKVVPKEFQQKAAKLPKQPQPLLLIQLDLGGQQTGEDLVLQMMDIQGDMSYYLPQVCFFTRNKLCFNGFQFSKLIL